MKTLTQSQNYYKIWNSLYPVRTLTQLTHGVGPPHKRTSAGPWVMAHLGHGLIRRWTHTDCLSSSAISFYYRPASFRRKICGLTWWQTNQIQLRTPQANTLPYSFHTRLISNQYPSIPVRSRMPCVSWRTGMLLTKLYIQIEASKLPLVLFSFVSISWKLFTSFELWSR